MESKTDEFNYPNWLYRGLVENYLPWERGAKMSFPEFNSRYTLHDSVWTGVFFDVAYDRAAILAIQWDAVWLPDEIKQSTSVVAEWPFLFIQLTELEDLSTSNYDSVRGIPRTISGCEFEEVNGKKFLAIDDVYGGQINLVYQGEETFLAMESDRTILSI